MSIPKRGRSTAPTPGSTSTAPPRRSLAWRYRSFLSSASRRYFARHIADRQSPDRSWPASSQRQARLQAREARMCGWLFPSPTGAPRWLSVPMHSAGAAKGHAAAKLCSRESKYVAQVPQQGQVGIAIESAIYPIHFELHLHDPLSKFNPVLCAPRGIDAKGANRGASVLNWCGCCWLTSCRRSGDPRAPESRCSWPTAFRPCCVQPGCELLKSRCGRAAPSQLIDIVKEIDIGSERGQSAK